MYKVGVCGHLGGKHIFLDGQTVKTKILTEELIKYFGNDEVKLADTFEWKKNSISFLVKCLCLSRECENIIILPAQNGVKVFAPLFLAINKLFHRKLHYIVIGGWLPDLLSKNTKLKRLLCKFDVIYAETFSNVEKLTNEGLNNVKYLPNFKQLKILNENELSYKNKRPYKLCTFSRVMKEKGIEDAIRVVKEINESQNKVLYTLDIFGPVDKDYEKKFYNLQRSFPQYISYKGMVDFKDSVHILKNYFALLFPTHFKTEGIPGTIIDSFAAGVPVIASEWESASEIIDGKTGFIYPFNDINKLSIILKNIYENPYEVYKKKINCVTKAKEYMPSNVITMLISNLK